MGQGRGGVWCEVGGGTTFRERGEEAATLNPKTTSWSHAQAVFLRVLPKNHLLQHWGDKSVTNKDTFFFHLFTNTTNEVLATAHDTSAYLGSRKV